MSGIRILSTRSYHTVPAKLRFEKRCAEVNLVDETGKEQLLSNKHVLHSKVITDVVDWGPGGCTPLPISVDLMRIWVTCIDSGLRGINSCDTLAKLLQVADVLIDEHTSTKVAQELARRIVLNSWMPAWYTDKVLSSLPRELASGVLLASNASLDFLLNRLPASQHVIALCAYNPAIEAFSSCSIRVPLHSDPSNYPALSLVSATASMTFLTTLKLTGCHLHQASTAMPKALTQFSRMAGLQELDLSSNLLDCSDAMHLFPSLYNLPLLHLRVADNQLEDAGVIVMSQHMSAISLITLLDVGGNGCGSVGAKELGSALYGLPNLQSLNVSENRICAEFVEVLVQNLASVPELRELCMKARGNCGQGFGNNGAVTLAEALSAAPKLERLRVECNRIGVVGCTALAQHMTQCERLSTLDLGRNRLGPGGSITALAQSFSNLSELQELILQGAEVYNEGAVTLANHLTRLSNLRLLNVGGCGLTVAGMRSLAGCLPELTSLQTLTLKDNLMFVAGCNVLLPALVEMGSLQDLSLRGCALGSRGAVAMALQLPGMNSLKRLDLAENGIRCVGAKALSVALTKMPQLVQLCLDDNAIETAGSAAIYDAALTTLAVRA